MSLLGLLLREKRLPVKRYSCASTSNDYSLSGVAEPGNGRNQSSAGLEYPNEGARYRDGVLEQALA